MNIKAIMGKGPIIKTADGVPLYLGSDRQLWKWCGELGQVTVANSFDAPDYIDKHCKEGNQRDELATYLRNHITTFAKRNLYKLMEGRGDKGVQGGDAKMPNT